MPRLKLTRIVFYLFLISFFSFIAFNVIVETNKRKQSKKKSDSLSNEVISSAHNAKLHVEKSAINVLQGATKNDESGGENYKEEDESKRLSLDSLTKSFAKLPWFMDGGSIRPKTKVGTFPYHKLAIWPDESPLEDRIVNQLMYIPQDYKPSAVKKLKKILLYFGRGGWAPKDLPSGQAKFLRDKCPVNTCEISLDANDAESADAIFFKDRFQWPRHRRHPKQIWILFLLECPGHTQSFRNLKNVFNWTATYRHDSDLVAPYEKFYSYPTSSQDSRLSTTAAATTSIYSLSKNKKVAWFVSNCGAKNKRLEFAQELGRYIDVDIYGGCGRNRCPRTRAKQCFEILNTSYKFYLAFENSNCLDYITEKFFVNGLMNDILPITMGARPEDYERNSPPNSYIHVNDFESAKDLAAYLHTVDQNSSLYNSYFDWKGTGQFINTYFWCRLCALLHSPRAERESHSYSDVHRWWTGPGVCNNKGWR